MDFNQYLQRIGVDRNILTANLESLNRLHYQHLLHVPFENLSIQCQQPISLELEDIYQKVVLNQRGGHCYELNHLFGHLLEELGFQVRRVSGKVITREGAVGPDHDHLCLIVSLDKQDFLADVGFGELFLYPKKMATPDPQPEAISSFEIRQLPEHYEIWMQDRPEKPFERKYLFTLTPQTISVFEEQNRIKQVDPSSHFVRHSMCSIATVDGRYTLFDHLFSHTQNGHKTKRTVNAESERQQILQAYFNIRL